MKKNVFIVFLMLLPFALHAEGDGANNHKEPIRKMIRENLEVFRKCYDKVDSNSGAKPEGKIVIEWEVSDLGKVADAKVLRDELKVPSLNDCILSELSRINFPAAPKGKTFSIKYPFVFKSQQKSKSEGP